MEKFQIVASEGFTLEDAMLEFNSVYIPINSVADRFKDLPESQRNKLYGKAATAIDSRVNKDLKELGIEPSDKTHDNVESVLAAYKAKINELTEANTKLKDNTEKSAKEEIEKLTQKIDDLARVNEKLKSDYELVSNEKKNIETEFTQKQIETIINNKINKAKSDFLLVEDTNIKKACAYDESQYKFGLDENQNEIVYNSEGKAVLSKLKAGEFASYKEVYESIFTENSAFKKVTGTGNLTLDRSQNTNTPIPNRVDMSSKITLGKK